MRRFPALVAVLVAVLAALAGCQSAFPGLRLTVATGPGTGVYYPFGNTLADVWAGELGIARPTVLQTPGSPDNVALLRAGRADVGFVAADAIGTGGGPRGLRALARIYDDYIQIVVRADLPITHLADLAGRRVSVGPAGSQVSIVADRILRAAGVSGALPAALGLTDSIAALADGRIDAFFWSGGLPTGGIADLAGRIGIRLLDLGTDPSGVLRTVRARYPVYGTAVIPVSAYESQGASAATLAGVTTLVVPNYLLVTDAMPDDVAESLTRGLFDAAQRLVAVNPAALAIDVHSAIYTGPVPLHPGALAYYRSSKN